MESLTKDTPPSSAENCHACLLTPVGQGGISQIGITGIASAEIIQDIFEPKRPWLPAKTTLAYGHIRDNDRLIDEVLVAFSPQPNMWEINCHGGYLAAKQILELLEKKGVQLQRPGGFWKATTLSLHDQIVMAELADCRCRQKIHFLLDQRVRVKNQIQKWLASVDMPVAEMHNEIQQMVRRRKRILPFLEPIPVVIAGFPNVGKSSLLNILAGYERAVVDNTPGTTRDPVREDCHWQGFDVDISDTAGMIESTSKIETSANRMTSLLLNQAAIVLWLTEDAEGPTTDDFNWIIPLKKKGTHVILVLNKCDLSGNRDGLADPIQGLTTVRISAARSTGIPSLQSAVLAEIGCTPDLFHYPMPVSEEEVSLLKQCLNSKDSRPILNSVYYQ